MLSSNFPDSWLFLPLVCSRTSKCRCIFDVVGLPTFWLSVIFCHLWLKAIVSLILLYTWMLSSLFSSSALDFRSRVSNGRTMSGSHSARVCALPGSPISHYLIILVIFRVLAPVYSHVPTDVMEKSLELEYHSQRIVRRSATVETPLYPTMEPDSYIGMYSVFFCSDT